MHRGREGSCSLPAGAAAQCWEMPGLIQPVKTGNSRQIFQLYRASVLQADPRDREVSLPLPHQLWVICVQTGAGAVSVTLSLVSVFQCKGVFQFTGTRLGFPSWCHVLEIIQKGLFPPLSSGWLVLSEMSKSWKLPYMICFLASLGTRWREMSGSPIARTSQVLNFWYFLLPEIQSYFSG